MSKKKKVKFEPELNEEQKAYIAELSAAEKEMEEAKGRYWALKRNCVHTLAYRIDYWFGNWPEGTAYCSLCRAHFGHYCPDSPDHACHYFTEQGKIILNNGQSIDPPLNHLGEPHNPGYETDDMCIFCGAPEERK